MSKVIPSIDTSGLDDVGLEATMKDLHIDDLDEDLANRRAKRMEEELRQLMPLFQRKKEIGRLGIDGVIYNIDEVKKSLGALRKLAEVNKNTEH